MIAPLPSPAGPPRQRPKTLTRRQREVMDLLCQGLPVKAIASKLGIADKTARNHLSAAYHALGCDSAVVAAVRYLQLALRPTPELPAYSLPACQGCVVTVGEVEEFEDWPRLRLWLMPCPEHQWVLGLGVGTEAR